MENSTENCDFFENLSLEEALKEYATCFDSDGQVINKNKQQALLKNKKLFRFLFSEENLTNNAKQEKNLLIKASAESLLNKSYPPSWYWKMPDYYYPGLYADNLQDDDKTDFFHEDDLEILKIKSTVSRNESVLNDCGWKREKYDVPEYYNDNFPNLKLVFKKGSNTVYFANINPDTKEELSKFEIPFGLLCGMFLKCRELEFTKPWELRSHDYKTKHPRLFEHDHGIIRSPETHEIINYGDWKPEKD